MSVFITWMKAIFGLAFMVLCGAFLLLVQVARWFPGAIFPNAPEGGLSDASSLLLAGMAFGWVMLLSARLDLLERER